MHLISSATAARRQRTCKLLAPAVVLLSVVAGRADAAPPVGKAEAALLAERYGNPYLSQMLRDKGNVASSDGFTQKRLVSDELQQVHVHVQQTQGGIPVWGGEAIVHMDATGSIITVTDNFVASVNPKAMSLRPILTAQRAIQVAMNSEKVPAAELASPAAADLWIYRHTDGDHLAWRVSLDRTAGKVPYISKPVVFVDAQNGKVLWGYDNLQTVPGTGYLMYGGTVTLETTPQVTPSGSIYQMRDATRGNQRTFNLNNATSGIGTLFTDADNLWGNTTATDPQTAGAEAQYGGAVTWDYYKNVHGRNGICTDGVAPLSLVHFGTQFSGAFWNDSCCCAIFGDGSGGVKPLTSIDVVGHEMSHGVTNRTAGLIYSGESGGLSEATSDIFGTCIEFYAHNTSDVGDYLIGEQIDYNGNGTPLRYMDDPSKDGDSAKCWSSSVGTQDVHYSSGVANHFFYLLSEGSGAKFIDGISYKSPTCNASTVTGITRAKAEKIWYRALTAYMTASTSYPGARTATLNAAADLYGACSAEETRVNAAWAAVNVVAPPPTPLTNGVPVSGIRDRACWNKYYSLDLPPGQSTLTFTTSGGAGRVDLYVKFGAIPDKATYDCRSYYGGNNKTCTFRNPAAGTWYVMLNAYTAYSGVTLTGTHSLPKGVQAILGVAPVLFD